MCIKILFSSTFKTVVTWMKGGEQSEVCNERVTYMEPQ